MARQAETFEDVEALADHLRSTHKEYQRKQRGPFLRMVERAVAANPSTPADARLQVCFASESISRPLQWVERTASLCHG